MIRSYWIIRSKEEGNAGGGDPESLREAVNKAAEEVENKDQKEEKEDTSSEEQDEKEGEETEEEDDLSEEDKKEAINLMKLLKNPNTAKATVQFLMDSTGIKIGEVKTEKEEKAAIKSIKGMIKEGLGEKYAFFADKLGETIEAAIEHAITEKTKDIREKQQQEENQRIEDKISAAQDKVISNYVDVPKKVLAEVMRIQSEGEVKPGPKANHENFFEVCLEMAAKNVGHKLTKKSSTTENGKGKSHPANNLSDRGGERNEHKTVAQAKTFKDAVNAAAEKVAASLAKK